MTTLRFGNIMVEVELITGSDGTEYLHFRHPLSGTWCQSINTVIEDMEKYYDQKKTEWRNLAEFIKKDDSLHEAVNNEVKDKEYF